MNFKDTLLAVELVIDTNEVPLIVGESGIGKTALAAELSKKRGWILVTIDGNLLKEGEIGGLPTVEEYGENSNKLKKRTVYAVHTKLQHIENYIHKGKDVLLFIDEINRCEHTVQQELMNLILNREINGYELHSRVKIMAAMNPSSKYGDDFDYQVVDMDSAQENRFVWLYMDSELRGWITWARDFGIDEKVMEFVSTFPQYLHDKEGEDFARATPRSYERVSKAYKMYKKNQDSIPRRVFLEVLKGNLGKRIGEEFLSFIEEDKLPLLGYDDIFNGDSISEEVKNIINNESHTRLYLIGQNILYRLDMEEISQIHIKKVIELLEEYPVDLRIGIMQEIKENHEGLYKLFLEADEFLELYFRPYKEIRE